MKRVTALVLTIVLMFALFASISEGQETEVTLDIADSYIFNVTPNVELISGQGVLEIKFSEYHSNNQVTMTIKSTDAPDSSIWSLRSSDGKNSIQYNVYDSNNSIISPNTMFRKTPSEVTQLRLVADEGDRRTAKVGRYSDHLTITIG